MSGFITTVHTPGDDEDYMPDTTPTVEEDGTLVLNHPEGGVEATYAPGEWTAVHCEIDQ